MKALALATALLAASSTHALAKDKLSNLHVFTGATKDGAVPQTPLLADGHGGFYGATFSGGASNLGTVFHVAADNSVTTIHEFAAGNGAAHPFANLLLQDDGSLVGGASSADGKDGMVVYKLSPSGQETVLHRFGRKSGAGGGRISGLAAGPDGAIYGTTLNGGRYQCGMLFRLAADDGRARVVHAFAGYANGDGCNPSGAPLLDAAGNLYGVTATGGAPGTSSFGGAVYRIAPDGSETILHVFSTVPASGDGKTPTGAVARDAHGNLFGTTYEGEAPASAGGVVWRIAAGDGAYSVVHAFTGNVFIDGDGAAPYGGVILDAHGNIYGTTEHGGLVNNGSVFTIAPDGFERVLHSFIAPDGGYPEVPPTLDASGNLVGTTTACGIKHGGGSCQWGTVFKLHLR